MQGLVTAVGQESCGTQFPSPLYLVSMVWHVLETLKPAEPKPAQTQSCRVQLPEQTLQSHSDRIDILGLPLNIEKVFKSKEGWALPAISATPGKYCLECKSLHIFSCVFPLLFSSRSFLSLSCWLMLLELPWALCARAAALTTCVCG